MRILLKTPVVGLLHQLGQKISMFADVVLPSRMPVPIPAMVIVHEIQTGLLKFVGDLRRLLESKFYPEVVLLRAECRKVVGLAVLGETDIELVVT